MFITTNRIYEPPQDDADGLRNEESEAVPEFANEENMVHEERRDEQRSREKYHPASLKKLYLTKQRSKLIVLIFSSFA